MAEKFLIKIEGEGFVLTQQGEGDVEAAKAAVAAVYTDAEVTGYGFGDDVDVTSG